MNKSLLKITPGALVCNEAEIIGDVSIGVRTIVHPKARIIAEKGIYLIKKINVQFLHLHKTIFLSFIEIE